MVDNEVQEKWYTFHDRFWYTFSRPLTKDTYNYYYAFSIDKNGNHLWNENGIALGTQDIENVITDTKGGAIFCGDEEAFQINVNGEFGQVITAIKNDNPLNVIKEFKLYQNYPNPFNPTTTIAFDLPEESHITLTIYDLSGREIVRLANENAPAGFRSVIWDGKDKFGQTAASGLYIYAMRTASGFHASKKMVFIR